MYWEQSRIYILLVSFSRKIFSSKVWLSLMLIFIVPAVTIALSSVLLNLFRINDTWTQDAQREIGGEVTRDLFHSALEHKLIKYNLSEDRFRIVTKRQWESLGTHSNFIGNYGFDEKTILGLLWKSRGSGNAIRSQVEKYNQKTGYAAIRENTGRLKKCVGKTSSRQPCRTSRWVAKLRTTDNNQKNTQNSLPVVHEDFDAERLTGNSPLISVFGGFALKQIQNFRDWYSVAGEEISGTKVVFTREPEQIPISGNKFYIDIVGSNITLPSAIESVAGMTLYCWSTNNTKVAMEKCNHPKKAIAARLSLPKKMARQKMAISADPVNIVGIPRFEDKSYFLPDKNTFSADATRKKSYDLTNNIRLRCFNRPDNNRYCAAEWLSAASRLYLLPRGGGGVLAIESAVETEDNANPDEQESVQVENAFIKLDKDGVLSITKRGRELGLESVIGQSSDDKFTLLNLLVSRPKGLESSKIELLIEPKLQEIVSKHFSNLLIRKTGLGGLEKGLAATYDERRRAGFVLLDLRNPETEGAILAVTGYPLYDGGLSQWDLRAIREIDTSRDPLAPHAWGAIDSRYTPGSTFKLVSALSFIDVASGITKHVGKGTQTVIQQAILGANSKFYSKNTDETLRRSETKIPKTNNAADGFFPLSDSSNAPPMSNAYRLPAGTCGRRSSNKRNKLKLVTKYGLCEAIAQSSNIWFARMAIRANRERLSKFWQGGKLSERLPVLVSTLQRLNLKENWSLLKVKDAEVEVDYSVGYLKADRILSGSESIALLGPGPGRLAQLTTGLNAYGQDVTASPLAMATVAASIGTGRSISPFLVRDQEFKAKSAPLYDDTSNSRGLLEILRNGMNAVVNKPGGTAYNSFKGKKARALAPKVYGKTGTATLKGHGIPGNSKVYGGWFVGWINQGTGPANQKPRYAFACGISHLTRGGSAVCAKLVANILVDIEASGF